MRREKDRIRAKELYRRMSPKEKAKHLWEYYRLPALGALLVLAAAILLISAVISGQRSKHDIHLGVFGAPAALGEAAERLAQEAGWDGGLVVATGPGVGGNDDEGLVQIICMLSADELDAVLCDRVTADYIQQEEQIPCLRIPLERTALASATAREGIELLLLRGTGRADKLPAFARLLSLSEWEP